MPDADDESNELPAAMAALIREWEIFVPDFVVGTPAYAQFELAKSGRCMTCEAPLGKNTLIIMQVNGVVGLYCGGACLQDIQILGFLQEQHADISQAIEFRGGAGDAPE